jgi:dipeptidyl-peptidase-3
VGALKEGAAKVGVSKKEFGDFLQYVAVFYGNMGNYVSFGDTKFVPRIPLDKLEAILKSAHNAQEITALWEKCKDRVYSLGVGERELGLDGKGISTYYSPNITRDEIARVQKFMDSISLSPYNTRLFKHDGPVYEIKIASAHAKGAAFHEYDGLKIKITYGDYADILALVADNLEKAAGFAANQNQVQMLDKYVQHFREGDIEDHKGAQRHWIKDVGPVVETNIGFIESYRDPFGVRGEFEGFVAVVNKDMSRKFGSLVESATSFIALLPWPKELEKDRFLRPDFTSLDVLSFASSGVPAGINIPNYDDIRQSEGFKNVSLGNVIASRKENEKMSFLRDEDQDLYTSLLVNAFEVQVGIHELLGHGSGKLLQRNQDGSFNFDEERLVHPLTGGKITSYYKPGETYDSVFLSLGSSLEECRAEACGIYLCTVPELLTIFGHNDITARENIFYVNWLNMARAGLLALEFYTPSQKKWRQAHMQGRYALMQVMLRAGGGLLRIIKSENDAQIVLDRAKIESVGRPAVAKFLLHIMTYKATADIQAATAFYEDYTSVDDEFLKLREIVLSQKKPRKVFVQVHTYIDAAGNVILQEFEDSPEGMIASFVTRFGDK